MLTIWEAERLDKVLTGGRTHPLVIECSLNHSEQRYNYQTFVVKAVGLPEVTEASLFREVFGNMLAREFGISTPTPALVNLSPQFVAAANLYLTNYRIHIRPGLAAGCEYFSQGFSSVVPGAFLTTEEANQATLLYAFDLLIQNPDRTTRKPNCALRAGQLMAFDFELAFSFLLLIGNLTPPWQVAAHSMGLQHLFYQALKDKTLDWQPFIVALRKLTKRRLQKLSAELPPAWQAQSERVCQHVLEAKRNSAKLEIELQRSLL